MIVPHPRAHKRARQVCRAPPTTRRPPPPPAAPGRPVRRASVSRSRLRCRLLCCTSLRQSALAYAPQPSPPRHPCLCAAHVLLPMCRRRRSDESAGVPALMHAPRLPPPPRLSSCNRRCHTSHTRSPPKPSRLASTAARPPQSPRHLSGGGRGECSARAAPTVRAHCPPPLCVVVGLCAAPPPMRPTAMRRPLPTPHAPLLLLLLRRRPPPAARGRKERARRRGRGGGGDAATPPRRHAATPPRFYAVSVSLSTGGGRPTPDRSRWLVMAW